MQNIKETSDTLRGPKVNARKHWDGESWILEDAKTRKPLLIGTSSQILDEYDRLDILPRLKPWDSLDSGSIIQPYRLKYSHCVQDLC